MANEVANLSITGSITDVAGTRADDVTVVSPESMGKCAINVAIDETPRKPRAGKQTPHTTKVIERLSPAPPRRKREQNAKRLEKAKKSP